MGRVERQFGSSSIKDGCEQYKDSSLRKAALACTINTEIGTVLAVMRRNVRWGGRFMSVDDHLEHSLIHSLKALRKQIFTWNSQWHNISPILYLQPFLDVIKSDETGAPITGVALSSVYKILTLDVFDLNTVNVDHAIHSVVDAVTSCRFEVTDPASEEVVLMKILQVLLACMKSKASIVLSNQHVCTIVDTCFRVVHQAGTKSELLQRIARHTMHELIRCVFSQLPEAENSEDIAVNEENIVRHEIGRLDNDHGQRVGQGDNGFAVTEDSSEVSSSNSVQNYFTGRLMSSEGEAANGFSKESEAESRNLLLMKLPYGVPCMVEILHFLCSLLNLAEHVMTGSKSNTLAFDEDVPLFALGLINSAIELGGSSFRRHPRLLSLIQDDLFHSLMQFGLSTSPLILAMVCGIVLNLYQYLRSELKLQIEAFLSSVILRLAQSRYGASYQQQEVALEALVDFCRQPTFMMEMFANFDCDISSSNVFEDLINLLSKSALPVNSPLSAMQVLALDGLIAVIQGMVDRIGEGSIGLENGQFNLEEFKPFWMVKCGSYTDPSCWVPFVSEMKFFKRRLMVGVDHFNRSPKKGLEFLQGANLLPKEPDPQSLAFFFRYTAGLDKNLIGDYLGNHDQFCVLVLQEFARTFDFQDMSMDTALRLFLETFRLPGESQKIQRILEAFSERYYEQSPHILANKDAALILSYSLILLNTDHHNVQVKRKMTEEDFIRNNRCINAGKDLPREFLSELYHSICKNEIRTTQEKDAGLPGVTPTLWLYMMHKSKSTSPYIIPDNKPYLDSDMFATVVGPTIAAISVVFDNAEDEALYQTCIDGSLAIAKVAAFYHVESVLDDLVISLCKFTTLLNPSYPEEFVMVFSDDKKAKMATIAIFTIANGYGDCIRTSWRNILDCILHLHEFGLISSRVASEASDDTVVSVNLSGLEKPLPNSSSSISKKPSGFMGRFSQLLSLDSEELNSLPTEEEITARQSTLEAIQKCEINNIFLESKFLQADSLFQLAQAIMAVGKSLKESNSPEDEEGAVFCLDLLIAVTLNNRDRISLLWQSVYEHISSIVQTTSMPCSLVEKSVFGLLSICQRLLPYKEDLADDLLKSLQLILKLDARVADAYCEQITQEVGRLVKANACLIKSHMGWRIVLSLLAITARHPEASESGFDALSFVMSEGAYLLPSNFSLCIDAARQFAESRVGEVERSVLALDLIAGSVTCLANWARETKEAMPQEEAEKMCQDIGEMWVRLVQGLKKCCLDDREKVRDHAIQTMQTCLTGVLEIRFPCHLWLHCTDTILFPLLDKLLEITVDPYQKTYRNMEFTLTLATKLISKVFLFSIHEFIKLTDFSKLWLNVLTRMENYMKVKIRGRKSEKLQELVPELLKNTLLFLKSSGVLVQGGSSESGDSLWELTWSHVNNIAPSLQSELFPDNETDKSVSNQVEQGAGQAINMVASSPGETVALKG